MHMEAGHVLGHGFTHHEARHLGGGVKDVGKAGQPAFRHQERPRPAPRLDGPAHYLLPLGDEEASLGLEMPPELDVPQRQIFGEALVTCIGDPDQLGHPGDYALDRAGPTGAGMAPRLSHSRDRRG